MYRKKFALGHRKEFGLAGNGIGLIIVGIFFLLEGKSFFFEDILNLSDETSKSMYPLFFMLFEVTGIIMIRKNIKKL